MHFITFPTKNLLKSPHLMLHTSLITRGSLEIKLALSTRKCFLMFEIMIHLHQTNLKGEKNGSIKLNAFLYLMKRFFANVVVYKFTGSVQHRFILLQ